MFRIGKCTEERLTLGVAKRVRKDTVSSASLPSVVLEINPNLSLLTLRAQSCILFPLPSSLFFLILPPFLLLPPFVFLPPFFLLSGCSGLKLTL